MISSVSSSMSYQSQQAVSRTAGQANRVATDSDGDNDNSKRGEVERQSRPISATVGNRINTTA
ncbi:hypothetical protein GKE73_16315 [Paludibacterium sp. dN 18-1]|uniref:Uncharacterized protein n=1 Tax=Paludibacterium denitrificans TaxID=2675226 RepID=A0A844GFF0_9NEIS|nr:hypothetical protein [Paludibacterium denitrificans]